LDEGIWEWGEKKGVRLTSILGNKGGIFFIRSFLARFSGARNERMKNTPGFPRMPDERLTAIKTIAKEPHAYEKKKGVAYGGGYLLTWLQTVISHVLPP